MTVAPEAVTPGFVGFAAIVVLLIAVILLIWDMNRRIRRVRYREEVREELDAEEAARAADAATETDAGLPITREGDDDPRRT
jgi:Na+-transporting methylmalonyl-CoA/oxaloacetate decarboxylase gamma subunit